MKNKGAKFSFLGALLFFFTIATAVSVSILVFVRVREQTDNIGVIAVVVLLVVLFFSVLYTLIDVLRRTLMVDKPAEEILRATERIARGDFSVRLAPSNRLADYDAYDRIKENVNIMAAELGKTEMLGNDFIANFSHEIKTPLAVIRNYAAALQSDTLDEATRREYLRTLLTATDRLSALVTNVLRLNKLENRKILPQNQSFRLDEQLAETALLFENLMEKKRITLSCELAELTVFSAPELLEIVWNNLLSNAVKFTNEGGRVGVTLRADGKNAVVTVWDDGCGIAPETGARLFDKFYQGDTSHASEGNGLGLALVKKIIDMLGGEITVSSKPSEGSAFTIVLKSVVTEDNRA